MRQKLPILVIAIGILGFAIMAFLFQTAIKQGLNLEPLIELRDSVKKEFPVTAVHVTRKKDEEEQEKNKKHWIRVEYVPETDTLQSADENSKSLAGKILKHVRLHYSGNREHVTGFRIIELKEESAEEPRVFLEEHLRKIPGSSPGKENQPSPAEKDASPEKKDKDKMEPSGERR